LGWCANGLRPPRQRMIVELGRACGSSARLSCASVSDSLPCYDLRCEVSSVVLFLMRPCLNPSLRGRPRTARHVRARAPVRPTPIKSIRSSCGTSRRSKSGTRLAQGPGPGDTSSWRKAAGIRARSSGESTPSHRRKASSCLLVFHGTLRHPGRRTGQRWEPTRAPRQGSKRNEGEPLGSPLFFFSPFIPL
jgi:hypothetical protein